MRSIKNKVIILVSILSLLSTEVFGQLQINPNGPITPVQAVQNILVGAGINAFNVTYNGSAALAQNVQQAVSEFAAGASGFPMSAGVVMQTQNAPSVNNDPDLAALAGQNVTNGSIIEFDFIPTGDTLSFNYIFASAEYTSFTCSNFNDVFGFFISGPGINGPFLNNAVNIATVPGSNNIPVGINTVNSGNATGGPASNCSNLDPNWQQNNVFFTTSFNPIFSSTGGVANFNGATITLAANTNLICNETYRIKLAVANAVDQAFDSGVFLEANSFTSDQINISINTGSINPFDTTLVANCQEGTVFFTRPQSQTNDSLVIEYNTSGTAVEGDDYNVLSPNGQIIMLPGEDTVAIVITPTNGGPANDPLLVIISAQTVTPCGDTITTTGEIWLLLEPEFSVSFTDTTILCRNDEVPIWANVVGEFTPITIEWDDGQTGNNAIVPVDGANGTYYFVFTGTDDCGFQVTDSAVVVLNQTLEVDTMFQFPTECGGSTGAVSGVGTGMTGTPLFTWTGPGPNSGNFINATVWQNLPSGWYYFSIQDNVCTVMDSIFLEQDPPPTASFTADPMAGFTPLNVNFTNTSDGGEIFNWDFGNGESVTVNNMSGQNTTYPDGGVFTVTLEVIEGNCSDMASLDIIVDPFIPLEFDLPNVFTPNGDGVNDVFTMNIENAIAYELTILNRWGNVIFQSSSLEAVWNGRDQSTGERCTDGVYFYKYSITDMKQEVVEGHGFVHLVNGTKE